MTRLMEDARLDSTENWKWYKNAYKVRDTELTTLETRDVKSP
jgi:hypothetical protein